MWLDRFSAHPSSASGASTPGPRGYSPARRPQHQQHLGAATQQSRPAFSPRSSSLSVSLTTTPNATSTSLPNTLRQASGSTFHRQNGSKPDQRPTGSTAVDPLEVLYGIIGKRPGTEADSDTPTIVHATGTVEATDKPECLVEDIDFGELSLEEFAQQKEEREEGKLKRRVDVQTIEQCFQDLHSAINGCDDVLKSVESYLSRFRTDLGVVSVEIESLQSRSAQLNSQHENRRNLERLLGPAVEDVSISPKVVHLISEGPINQEWVKALNEVETRSANIEANMSTASNVRAVEDIKPLLSDLKAKAIERIRDYLVAQIKAIRSPNINAQIIQQQSLIKYKDLYGFLSRNHSALTEEIIQAYINTMRWYYLSNFTRYHQALEKLKVHSAERNDLLGGDPSAQKASEENSSHATTTNPNAKVNPKTQPLIHGLEIPFRNFNLALIDNISAEYSFVAEMFVTKTQSLRTSSRRVIEMFEPVFALGHSLTKHLIDSSTDCLGILLCVRLNQHFAFELQRRKVPVARQLYHGVTCSPGPRFQMGILALSSEAGDDEPVSNSLARLRVEFDALLVKLAKAANGADARGRERFLWSNYSLIGTIISDTRGRLAEEVKEHYTQLIKNSAGRR
ncbi:conserved hypothetical protein [Histoplasma mississippiense (nom. inval.)]|uniref:conserved hypothetical protein n=1 Tax=Ajellomyces capsulatus (strain NAm1 / WU24) TaxID=2059318 RepID=UPI000157CEAA|nr:conserved hypothetical protein [Histoplasma mississippiense (nom. inval.)]EDN10219.1 conserved hypothetical protein [Histoplasma mississippiense (nom. inval.)]